MLNNILTIKRSERFKDKLEKGLPVYANLLNGERFRVVLIENALLLTQCGKSIDLKLVDNFD